MKINFVLVASGSLTTPQLNVAVFADTVILAKKEAAKMVGQLSKAGYFQFHLFDVSEDDHQRICHFAVEQPEPVVTVR